MRALCLDPITLTLGQLCHVLGISAPVSAIVLALAILKILLYESLANAGENSNDSPTAMAKMFVPHLLQIRMLKPYAQRDGIRGP